MKNIILYLVVLTQTFALGLAGCSSNATAQSPAVAAAPWPSHAPEATPYIHVYTGNEAAADAGGDAEAFETAWDAMYERFGSFYARKAEFEMFRSLPQEEAYPFVPHSEGFSLNEGEAMRMAMLFGEMEGCEAKVIALHQITAGVDDWNYLTVVTMTPSRMFELSTELEESFMIEQLYEGVRERFDIDYWPDGLYEETQAALQDYAVKDCFYFEDADLARLEKLERDTACDYLLREYTPDGWGQNGQDLPWQLQGTEGIAVRLYCRRESEASACVVTMTPVQMSLLSERLKGRYLVQFADESVLAGYDLILNVDLETGEVSQA